MIYVIDKANRSAFKDQLEEMYRIRHDIYVVRRGWKALEKPDGRDIDQFDTEDTVYLIGIDDEGRVTAGLRLNPTIKPHLINTVFPHAIKGRPIPISPDIYEFTRWFVVKDRVSGNDNRRMAGELLAAMFEYGLIRGLSHFTLLCDAFFWRTMRELRWDVEKICEPTKYDEGTFICVLFPASVDNLRNTQEAREIEGSVLVYSHKPFTRRKEDDQSVAA